jgi:hypothetical protein
MKKVKKLASVIVTAILISILLCLTSCNKEKETGPENNEDNSLTPVWVYDEIPYLEFAEISRDGKWAIVAGNYKIAFLDLVNKQKLYELNLSESENDYVEDVSISDQGYAVVGTSKGIKVFSSTQGLIANISTVEGRPIGGRPVKIAPSGNVYYAYGYIKFTVPNNLVWSIPTELQDQQGNWYYNPNFELSNDLDVSGNGEYIASSSSIYNSPVLVSDEGVIIWESTYDNDAIESIKISYDGSKIVVGTLSEVSIYSSNNPTPLFRWAHNGYYARVAISDNGNIIAAGTSHGKLAIFDNNPENPIVYDGPDGQTNDIAISSDGNIIVLATDFGGLEIYDKGGNLKYQHDSQYSGVVGSLSIATDGKTIGCVFHRKFHLYKLP